MKWSLFTALAKSSMIPRPGTSQNGIMHPYYVCGKAEKTKGIDCDLIYLPARGIDEVLIEFIRRLKLKHEVIEKVIGEANKASFSQLKLLCTDLERIQNELRVIRQRSSNFGSGAIQAVRGAYHWFPLVTF